MDALEDWHDFNVAMTGATAALAGLVIVAASVNIREIVKETSLTARLATGIAGLVLAISGSAVGLMPELTAATYGLAMILLALLATVFSVHAARTIVQNRHPENTLKSVKIGLGFLVPSAYIVGGLLLVTGSLSGIVWFAVGSILAIVVALLVSWIVLVEVLR